MKTTVLARRLLALAASALMAFAPPAQAQLADLADVPLANSPSTSVLPNLMYVLDDSGSMNFNYMPDQIFRTSGQVVYPHCRRCVTATISNLDTNADTFTTSANHQGVARSQVTFTAGTPPAGASLNTVYYIRGNPVSTTRFVLETANGTLLNITGNNSQTGATVSICTGPGPAVNAGTATTNGQACGNEDPTTPNATVGTGTDVVYGDPPFYAPAFNKIWYNPDITYSPPVDSTGTSLGNANPASAKRDHYSDPTLVNLTNQIPEIVYCNVSAPTAAQLTDTTKCRYNGRHNVSGGLLGGTAPNYFMMYGETFSSAAGSNEAYPAREFTFRKVVTTSGAHYYKILPHEYCSDSQLGNCALATAAGAAPDATNVVPAPVRWCKTFDDAQSPFVVSGTSGTPATPRCRKKFDATTHPFPRLGRFQRVDIVVGQSYPKSATAVRTDCAAAASCTGAEELQNFANWFSYYRIRMSLMKTATGKAFLSIDDRFRVGFITINPNNPVTASKFLGVGKFDAAQRLAFYTKLYAQATNGGTPLREALSRIGRYYAGKTTGINAGMTPDPMTHSCQTNYALLTTDGYWNGNSGDDLAGSAIANVDNTDSGYFTRASGAFDGNRAGASGTLADVAGYYYANDLRTDPTLGPDNVPTNPKDTNSQQHMVTFTLGLGLEGFMDFQPDYETSPTGDFARIKSGASGCVWATGACDWPVPAQNAPSTLDDLWHAAVNGRGAYFSAGDPNSLALGLQSALARLRVATAAASASATSSPNITQTDNFIYSTTFRTGIWDGEIVARRIDTVSGNVQPTIIWSAQAQLDAATQGTSDSRSIFTIGSSAGTRKDFRFSQLTSSPSGGLAAEQAYFTNKCGAFGQCTLLTAGQQADANSGDNLVNYLRGQRQFEQFTLPETIAAFRTREHVLGDPVNATPAFVRRPEFDFGDAVTPSYGQFKLDQANRQPVLYIAANDGMLHAFNGDTGIEMWAYVPRITMPNLHKLANANWSATHQFNVDGSPQVMDIFDSGSNQWRTVLIAGLNGGGRGYYALDVTDPSPGAVRVLWEFCSDSTLCTNSDTDLGFTFGNAVISKRASDGRWVAFVTSGLNNVSPGTGQGYLWTLDVITGAVLSKVSTGFGTAAAPSGLNRISGFADDFITDNTTKFIYGGDLFGNVWRFDTSAGTPTVFKLATLKDGAGRVQSITTKPELTVINNKRVVYVGTGRYLGEDDLVDPATLVPAQSFAYQQSLYAIKDRDVNYPNFRAATGVVVNTITPGGNTRTTSNNTVDWNLQDGWYVDFNPANSSPGERVNLDPQLVQGILIVTTNVPNNSACTVGGDSWLYFFDYKNGKFVSTSANGVVGQKRVGEITVGTVVVRLPSGAIRVIATGATGRMDTIRPPDPDIRYPGRRVSWRELFQR